MKCPNCGADMPNNSLYCANCGEDIHIVPDFETVVEDDIQKAIQGIVDEISEEEMEIVSSPVTDTVDLWEEEVSPDDVLNKQGKKPGGKKKYLVIACWMIAVIGLLATALFAYRLIQSSDYQLNKAKEASDKGQYENSVKYYERLIEQEPDNISLKFSLAEVYSLESKDEEYEQILLEIIHSPNATVEELNGAYGKLIAVYRAKGEYETIHSLLLESNNDMIIATYNDYIAQAPEFSVPEGYYNDVQPLKISAAGQGIIYYTINGKDPDDTCTQYTAPIVLDEGEYLIKAIFVNELGIVSDMTSCEYHITIDQLEEPEISAMSGEYKFPINIEILEEDEDVYYTTDGSDPTIASMMYTVPIHMPLGQSVFKFIRIRDGRSSEIAVREYDLELDTKYTPQDAERDVLQYALKSGKIYDEWGHSYETQSTYGYEYQYVTEINEVDYFYVLSEVIKDPEGIVTKTGNHFAVNAYNGKIMKLQIDELNNYLLVEIEG